MNEYSSAWSDLFLRNFDAAQTACEAAFLQRQLPRAQFPRILDLCCGLGRHAGELADAGYEVTGVDRDAELVLEASRRQERAQFLVHDMRRLNELNGTFDAVVCLWQSYGYFDAPSNEKVLADIAARLRDGGRFVLDIYHRGFFEQHVGERSFERDGKTITESKTVSDDRLRVRLDYHDGAFDEFDWQVFTPAQIFQVALPHGFCAMLCCRDFDEAKSASADSPRMQIVFEKRR